MSAAPLPPYEYRCVDRSVLIGPFRRHWAELFLRTVPPRVPANFVTLLASAFMWALLAGAVLAWPLAPAARGVVFAVLLHCYLVYDHVDGMQAKKTRTSSALGEYLDHSLDVYHGAIAVLAIFALVGFDDRLTVLLMLACSHLAFAATMVEEKERGELYFGPLGSLEGVLLFIAFCLSWTVPGIRTWWLAPLLGGWPAYYLLIAGGALGSLLAVADCLRRIGRTPVPFLWFGAGQILLVAGLERAEVPLWASVAILMLHGGDYVGRVIGSHLLRTPHPQPDFVGPAAALALLAFPAAGGWHPLLVTWLALRTAWGIVRTLRPLRSCWLWANPLPVTS